MDLLIEVTNTPVIECLLLLLLTGDERKKIDWTNSLIKDYFNQYIELKEKAMANEFIQLVLKNNFSNDVMEDKSLTHLHIRLEKLKRQLLKVYFTSLKKDAELYKEYEYIGDFSSLVSKYFLQMEKLKLVIQPDIQIATSVHSVSKITYLTARGFWFDEQGNRKRKYVKSLGRLDEFEGGKKDPKVLKLGIEKIREESLKEYKQQYPD